MRRELMPVTAVIPMEVDRVLFLLPWLEYLWRQAVDWFLHLRIPSKDRTRPLVFSLLPRSHNLQRPIF